MCSLAARPDFDDAAGWAATAGLQPLELGGGPLRNVIFQGIEDGAHWRFRDMYGQLLADSPRVRVVHGATVLRLRSSGRRVEGLDAATVEDGRAGRRLDVVADTHVLAQGGIESVRLLLLSGLGNPELLGRFFMVHPVFAGVARVIFPTELPTAVARLYAEQTLLPIGPEAGPLGFEPQPSLGMALRVATPAPPFLLAPPRRPGRVRFWAALAPTREALGNGLGNFRVTLRAEDTRRFVADIGWEQVPDRENRISLHPTRRDPIFGQPCVRLDWRLLPQDEATLRCALALLSRQMIRLGAVTAPEVELRRPSTEWACLADGPRFLWPGDHHLGGARMSHDPAQACLAADGRVIGTDNLYVASSASFPTGGFANPTLTIVAMALRLADSLSDTD
jgi:choline dehydrogenase-like flavoprotein